MNDPIDRRGKRGLWTALWTPPKTRWLLGIPAGAVLAVLVGAVGYGGFTEVLHATSTNEFCFGCHSHDRFVRPEYEASSHFRNEVGVRAMCADCHLPHGQIALILTKIRVSADIIPELMGRLETAEKFEAARAEMAEAVWTRFRANDSEYCRHCHTVDAMALDAQSNMARRRHETMSDSGRTCIDCHRGLVHALPQAEPAGSESL